jgi:hypothetical protein
MGRGDLVVAVLFGIFLIIMGLTILTYGGIYRGYPLPRVGGLVEIVFGIIWLFSLRKRK